MFKFLKKKTREEQVSFKTEKVFTMLIYDSEFEFTDLEIVQILNNTRRMLSGHLKEKRAEALEHSVNYNQKAVEINVALEYVE